MAVLETPARIEPCALETFPAPLADVISGIAAAASTLGNRLHPRTAGSLASLVRVMNCYYSNLIEGHDTRPRDIERVLFDDLEAPAQRRNLQLEARAHVRVQQWFCEVMLDQVTFMARLFDLDNLASRLHAHVVGDLRLPEAASALARAILQRGELPRGEARAVLGIPERTAREMVSRLVHSEIAGSDTPKSALYLRFTTASADALFPRLFPAPA